LDLKKFGFAQKSDDSPIVHTFKVLITDHTIDPIIKKLSYSVGFTSLFKKIKADLYNSCGADELTYFALKNSNKPVVMDLHNGSIMHGIENLSKENYERDKFCYENIGGIIHRGPDFEIEYYKNHGYNITCPILNFFDYCNRDFFVNKKIKKLSSEDGEPHLVNIGSGMQSKYIPKMLRSFFKQKIHMHIYLVPYSTIWNVYQHYVKLDKNEKYFHLHDTLPFNKIQEDIAKYDFGAIIRPTEVMDSYTPEAMKIAARSYRQYNFLEAGLPIIINDRLEYYAKIVEDNRIGFSVKNKELANLRKKIKMYNYDELRKNVLKAREKFLIDKHIKRLDNYYESLIVKN
jgi:glycosyltransferase involved in cell wall biosynthesis